MTYKQHEGENFCCDALNYMIRKCECCPCQDGQIKIKIPRGSAACEGRSIVCFVCVLVHLYSVEE